MKNKKHYFFRFTVLSSSQFPTSSFYDDMQGFIFSYKIQHLIRFINFALYFFCKQLIILFINVKILKMKKLAFSISLLFLTVFGFSQISVMDFIKNPSKQMPSFAANQPEQFRSVFDYRLSPENLFSSEIFSMSNEFKISKINSGFGINFQNETFLNDYRKTLGFSYNYKIKTESAVFIPAVSYENVKYSSTQITYADSTTLTNVYGYSNVNVSFAVLMKRLNFGIGVKSINQPEINYPNYSGTLPIVYQLFASWNLFNKRKLIEYLQLVTYCENSKSIMDNYWISRLSLGMNAKIKFLRLGYDINLESIIPDTYNYNTNLLDNTNFFIGVEKDYVNFYYSLNKINSNYSFDPTHSFTLGVNFELFNRN